MVGRRLALVFDEELVDPVLTDAVLAVPTE